MNESIRFVEIDEALEKKIIEQYGEWVSFYDCIPHGEGCITVAAFIEDEAAGFATVRPGQWIPPLEQYQDAFIEAIEVKEAYRRQGIGRQMIQILEEKSRKIGYRQIRAWSSDDKVEALNMWYDLGYCMCPAAMLGVSRKPGFEHQQIVGYYYAKLL